MATVTVYTSERMKEIEDNSIESAEIVEGNLILHRRDGSSVNAGDVQYTSGAFGSFQIANDAIAQALGINSAVYDPVSNCTFIVYQGEMREARVTYFDHSRGQMGETAYIVGAYDVSGKPSAPGIPIPYNDSHGVPTITIDGDGYIHVVWAAHISYIRYAKSNSPRNVVDGFSTVVDRTDMPVGTYTKLVYDPTSDAIYLAYRPGEGHTNSVFGDSHEKMTLLKSINNGVTWTPVPSTYAINSAEQPENATDVYCLSRMVTDRGRVWMAWTLSHSTIHDRNRSNIYVAYYDTEANVMRSVNGTNLGTTIHWAEFPQVLAYEHWSDRWSDADPVSDNGHAVNAPQLEVDPNTGYPCVIFHDRDDTDSSWPTKTVKWNGSAWVVATLPDSRKGAGMAFHVPAIRHMQGDNWEAFVTRQEQYGVSFGSIYRYTSDDGCVTWDLDGIVIKKNELSGIYGSASITSIEKAKSAFPFLWQPYHAGTLPTSEIYGITSDAYVRAATAHRAFTPFKSKIIEIPLTVVGFWTGNEGILDDFARPNANALGTPTIGIGDWIDLRGDWQVLNQRAYKNVPNEATGWDAVVVPTGLPDGIVSADVIAGNVGGGYPDDWGLCFRVLDLNNMMHVVLHKNGSTVVLQKTEAGVNTILAAIAVPGGFVAGDIVPVEINMNGASISVKVRGSTLLNYTMTAAELGMFGTAHQHGLLVPEDTGNAHQGRWDNFKVTNLAGTAPFLGTIPTGNPASGVGTASLMHVVDAGALLGGAINVKAVKLIVFATCTASKALPGVSSVVYFRPAGTLETNSPERLSWNSSNGINYMSTPWVGLNNYGKFEFSVPNPGMIKSFQMYITAVKTHDRLST